MPPRPTRKPLITSSRISSAPCSRHSAASVRSHSSRCGRRPKFAGNGSTMAAAIARAVLLEHPPQRVVVVERCDERVTEDPVRDTIARGGDVLAFDSLVAQGKPAAGADEHGVGVAVITPLEFEDAGPAGCRPRDPQCRHHGFGAGRDESDTFDPRQPAGDPFGKVQRVPARTLRTTSRRLSPGEPPARRPGRRGRE